MMPGRSLSVKTTGRSWAPVATTIERARMRHTRWRERGSGAATPRWSVRRASPGTGGGERGGQPGRPGANDEHVDVVVHGVVAGGVRDVRESSLPRQAA